MEFQVMNIISQCALSRKPLWFEPTTTFWLSDEHIRLWQCHALHFGLLWKTFISSNNSLLQKIIKESELKTPHCYLSPHWRHHNIKFFVIDLSVAVNVNIVDQIFNLLVTQFFAQVHHHGSKLTSVDETVPILKIAKEISTLFKERSQYLSARLFCNNMNPGITGKFRLALHAYCRLSYLLKLT